MLSACAPADTVGTPTPTAGDSAAPSPSPSAASARTLVLGVDGLAVVEGEAQTESFPLDAPESLLTLVEELTGEPRSGEDFEDPWGNGEVWGTTYTWDDITISVLKDGPASVTVLATTIGGVPVSTAGGVMVGATRDAVIAAGGWDEWDEDGDGVADHLGLDEQDVEGTQSLSRPGEVGRQFVSVALEDDLVTALRTPANDFSDL